MLAIAVIELFADFTASYERWLLGLQAEPPVGLDYPELTREEIIACQTAAHNRVRS